MRPSTEMFNGRGVNWGPDLKGVGDVTPENVLNQSCVLEYYI